MPKPISPCVYILANKPNGALYTGVTSDLLGRVAKHINGDFEGFTSKFGICMLVWFEEHADMEGAITREKQIKRWKRDWKIRLIEKMNPEWKDLTADLF